MLRRWFAAAGCAACLLHCAFDATAASLAATSSSEAPLATELNETIVRLPVTVSMRHGQSAHGEMILTVFRPAGPGPFPVAIVNHGRSSTDRAHPTRVRMIGISSYLVRQGFAVFVPTRLGYGGSVAFSESQPGEVDPEESGNCREEDYAGALSPAVQEIAATLNYARQQKFADASLHFVVGQSVGGAATVAYGATHPPGLMGYVNFGGGLGGNPVSHPGIPCQSESLTQLYDALGKTTRAPSLWIYAENDRYFAPSLTSEWHRAFANGGSPSQFVLLPPFGGDGHTLLAEGLPHWRPLLDKELARLGLMVSPPPALPRASGYATIQDVGRIPWPGSESRTRGYARFLAATPPRAFAISESGHWGWANGPEEPASAALAYCNRVSPKPCVLYAIDNTVIWTPREPVTDKTAPAKSH